jgi:hypothetical protein
LFPASDLNYFITSVNTFIRLYMTHFDDFFVEEVTLHHLGSTITRGILIIHKCEGQKIYNVSEVHKIPPMMRRPWYNHPKEKIESFSTKLKDGNLPDSVQLLAVRAKAFRERGAFRSAIIEASAALETAVARRIRSDFISKGKNEEEVKTILNENQRFSDRCKKIMKMSSGFSAAEIDPPLWERIVKHRDNYRHKIAHSDIEPSKTEAEEAVSDFISLAQQIRDRT